MASFNTKKALSALAAFATSAFAGIDGKQLGVGFAIVQNQCSYPVYVVNVPAADGGFDQSTYTLHSNGANAPYRFQYTQLNNQDGWSIKLSKSATDLSNIMQFETTFHDDGTIWYDLSDVNGNPWDKNWMITASNESSCNPKQQAYRYSTDDAYGMQACKQGASLTVTLCSGSEAAAGEASSASSSAESDQNTSQTDATTYSTAPEHLVVPTFGGAVQEVGTTLQTTTSPSTTSPSSTSSPASYSSPTFSAPADANVVATVTQVAGTTTVVTTTWQGAPSDFPGKRDLEMDEHARAHEQIKRRRDAHHRHHGHF
ncbi:hypothetical protein EV356DRAFT_506935 [Viridothelium virens]|uniref:Uncharacterized protein n=1 Tax=Viridothelium virens TaxID=1048519 RepID=A0A6A6H062_VIRVR|nr:hypothetical protein EV356DRAFT_506935 [Viridothelium virens]